MEEDLLAGLIGEGAPCGLAVLLELSGQGRSAAELRAAAAVLDRMEEHKWVEVLRNADWLEGWSLVPADPSYRQLALARYERQWLVNESAVDYGLIDHELPGLFFEITPAGREEYLRRAGPTPDDDCWKAERSDDRTVIWAKTKEIADRVASELLNSRVPQPSNVHRATFTLKTGEKIVGIKAEYANR